VSVDRDELIERLAELPGAVLGEGAFAPGPAIWAGRREVAHFDRDGMLEVRLTKGVIRARRVQLRADPRVRLRAGASDWIAVDLEAGDPTDASEVAAALIEDALAANLPTAEPGPPPTGAELERRRRFH
jgi:hypothetical protein